MDYTVLMLNPIYTVQGVPVVLTLADTRVFTTFTMLDKTAGVTTGDNIEVPTLTPAACVRSQELIAAGLAVDDLMDATLQINGYNWTVTNYKLRPTPGGEKDGEYFLLLAGKEDASDTPSSS